MTLRLTLLWLLLTTAGWSQPEFTLRSGEELSFQNEYGRSTAQLEAFIEANPARLYDHSQALLLISYNHMQLGDYTAALAANGSSLELKARLRADDLVNNYVRYGAIHLLRGNFHEALSYLQQAKNFPIEDLLLYAHIDAHLAAAYRGLHQWELAQTHYRQAIESLLIEYPEDYPDVIMNYYQLGSLYLDWNRPEDARSYFQQGLEQNGAAPGQLFLNILLNNALGGAYPDQPAQAAVFHRRAFDLADQIFGRYHRETALSGLSLAKALYRQGRRDEARDFIESAIRGLNPEQPGLSWQELPDQNGLVIDQALLAEALGLKASWLMDSALPRDQRLQPALINSERAATLLEAAMDDRIDQADRLELIPIAQRALVPGIQAGIQLWKEEKEHSGKVRAIQLLARLKRLRFRAHTTSILSLDGEYAVAERELHRQLRLAEMNFRLQSRDLTVGRQLRRLQQEYRTLRTEWERREPDTYRLRFGPSSRTLAQLQAQMAPNDAYLTYLIEEKSGWVFAIGKTDMEIFAIPSAEADPTISLQDELLLLNNQFRQAIAVSDAEGVVDYGHRLYNRLLAPAGNWLKSKEALHILGDKVLDRLPFEALLTKPVRNKRIRFHRLPYLIHDFSVQYRHLMFPAEDRDDLSRPSYELLGLAPFTLEEAAVAVHSSHQLLFEPRLHPSSVLVERGRFIPLPATEEETNQLKSVLAQSNRQGSFQVGKAATESVLLQELQRAHFIHLTSYAFVKGPSPEEAGLVLRQDQAPQTPDGILLASELPPFTACTTDLLSIDFLEVDPLLSSYGVSSLPLTGRLLLSGVPYLLYGDRLEAAGAKFFPHVYTALLRGRPVAQAVQGAKQSLAQTEALAAPVWWSAFRLLER